MCQLCKVNNMTDSNILSRYTNTSTSAASVSASANGDVDPRTLSPPTPKPLGGRLCCPCRVCCKCSMCLGTSCIESCKTIFCVGCCLKPKKPSWNKRFEISIDIVRNVSFNIDPDYRQMRFMLDHDVPTWAPHMPKGIRFQRGDQLLSVGVGLGSLGNNSDSNSNSNSLSLSSEVPIYNHTLGYEWIYHELEGPPCDERSNILNPELRKRRIILYFHGGAFVFGTRASHRMLLYHLASVTGATILSIEYRKSPEYPYPVPPLDCFEAYKWLVKTVDDPSSQIFVAGDSAGGALAVETLTRCRDAKLPSPAGGILLSPWCDIFNTVDPSFTSNLNSDFIPPHLVGYCAKSYCPIPLDGKLPSVINLPLTGIPPLHIAVGDSEVLRDQILRFADMARSQNVDVCVKSYSEMPHVFQLLIFTELKTIFDSLNDIKLFVDRFRSIEGKDGGSSIESVEVSVV